MPEKPIFADRIIYHVPCSIKGCDQNECDFDSLGKPYCKIHWNFAK
mgnify:CR=1 FL=1